MQGEINQVVSKEISRLLEHRHYNHVLNLYQQGCHRNGGGLERISPTRKEEKEKEMVDGEKDHQHKKRVHLVSKQDKKLKSMEDSDFKTSHVSLPVVKLRSEKWEKKAQGRSVKTDPYTQCLYFISYCTSDGSRTNKNEKTEFCRCYRGKDAIGFTNNF